MTLRAIVYINMCDANVNIWKIWVDGWELLLETYLGRWRVAEDSRRLGCGLLGEGRKSDTFEFEHAKEEVQDGWWHWRTICVAMNRYYIFRLVFLLQRPSLLPRRYANMPPVLNVRRNTGMGYYKRKYWKQNIWKKSSSHRNWNHKI